VQRDGAMHPDRYELYDQWFHSLDCLWPTHALQPIELARIRRWDEVNVLPRTGRIGRAPARHAAGKLSGAGCTPADRLY
ncbi:signal peptide prediction, partial [Burkholderia sp. SIMBA_024]